MIPIPNPEADELRRVLKRRDVRIVELEAECDRLTRRIGELERRQDEIDLVASMRILLQRANAITVPPK